MMMKRISLLMGLMGTGIQSYGSDTFPDELQKQCETRFFDRYDSRLEIVLRIRENLLYYHKEQAFLSMEKVLKSKKYSCQEVEHVSQAHDKLRQRCNCFHRKLLVALQKTMDEIEGDIEPHFFKRDDLSFVANVDQVSDREQKRLLEDVKEPRMLSRVEADDKQPKIIGFFKRLFYGIGELISCD